MSNTMCIYHANCNDGRGAALAVYYSYTETAAYVPMHYGDDLPENVDEHEVIMVDFSLKREQMRELSRRAKSVTVIDHHKTAQAELEGIEDELPNVKCFFDMTRSGAALAWHHLQGFIPPLIEYIEDRDLWKFQLDGTRDIHAALGVYPDWTQWLDISIDQLKTEGKAIRTYLDMRADEVASNPPITWDITGDTVPVYNIQGFMISDTLHIAMKKHGSPYAVAYFDLPDKRVYSLRSMDGSDIDVSEIAKAYGGGGHKHAAGFTVNR